MGFRRHLIGSLAAAAIVAPSLVSADAPTTKWYDKVTLNGYVEAYYQALLIDGSGVAAPQAPQNRLFDNKQGQFTLGGGELILGSSDDSTKTSYNLDLIYGQKAASINGDTNSVLSVAQANLTKTWGNAKFTLGKFGTFLGTEVWNTTADTNFSRGIVFQMKPFFEVGLKLDYTLPADFVLSGMIDNGMNKNDAVTSDKGYGAMLAYSGIKNLSLSGSWYKNPTIVGTHIIEQDFGNVLAAFKLSDALSFNAEYLYMSTPQVSVPTPYKVNQGIALYVNYNTPISGLAINGRAEQVTQVDAVVVNDAYTLTVKYADGPLTHILEYRADAANGYVYPGFKATDQASQTQNTITYAATYGF